MDFLNCGVCISLIHPMVEYSLNICRGNIANNLFTKQGIYLVQYGAFIPIIGSSFYWAESLTLFGISAFRSTQRRQNRRHPLIFGATR